MKKPSAFSVLEIMVYYIFIPTTGLFVGVGTIYSNFKIPPSSNKMMFMGIVSIVGTILFLLWIDFKRRNFARQIDEWVALYKKYFGIDIDPSKITIRAKQVGYDRLIIIAKGMKIQQVYDQLSKLVVFCKDKDKNLDDAVTHNDREATESYAIWVRDRIEADEENKKKSASDLAKENHTGITLLERLLLELHHFYTTREHLDTESFTSSSGTLCSGSRFADGSVPVVYFCVYGKGRVTRSSPYRADYHIRSREVVSA